jgi:hypothetical protein
MTPSDLLADFHRKPLHSRQPASTYDGIRDPACWPELAEIEQLAADHDLHSDPESKALRVWEGQDE